MIKKFPVTGLFVIGLLAIATLAFTPLVTSVQAHKGASGVVKKRMDAMKDMKSQLKVIEQMLESKKHYSAKKIHKALDIIRAQSGAEMSKLFPKGTAHKPSEADPAIWKNGAEFKKMTISLIHSIDEFRAKLPEKINMEKLEALKKGALVIRRSCKTCHDRFRL
ncbi:MAG: cytochrome c [bacterium]|nr:cytochrome c [bacterium]